MAHKIIVALAFAVAPVQLVAQAPEPQAENVAGPLEAAAAGVAAVLQGATTPDMVFAPAFLAQVSESQLSVLAEQLTSQFGAIEGVAGVEMTDMRQATIRLRFERAFVGGPIAIGPDGKVLGLLLNDIQPLDDSVDRIAADIAAMPGEVSLLYAPLDRWKEPILAIDPDKQLAIGSAFKLYVLSALAHQVERGVRSWDEVVTLDTRSLPSGILQDWPEGAPITLHTLAALMISISDNTATDQLIHLLGRSAVGEEVITSGHSEPARILPLLTTLELFGYKGDPTRAGFYAMADEDPQGVLLEAFAQEIARNPDKIVPPRFIEPTMIDSIEWFASASDIRRIMERLVALDDPTARRILAISPSLSERKRAGWAYVGYKGGSEPGVLNLSWLLQSPAGEWYVLAMTWNNPEAPVDHSQFELLAQRLLSLPHS